MPRPLFTIRTQLWDPEWIRLEVNTINVPANELDDDHHVALVDLGLAEDTARIFRDCLNEYLGDDDA